MKFTDLCGIATLSNFFANFTNFPGELTVFKDFQGGELKFSWSL